MRVLLVDNFDSFTHNLAQAVGSLGAEVVVRRNDASVAALLALRPARVLVSPGPGGPDRTGACARLLDALPSTVPVLGVCLGMQLLATLAGAQVRRAPRPVHGRASRLRHDGQGPFAGLPQGLLVARYHSLCVAEETLPARVEATAWADDGVLMALRFRDRPWQGVQFHPESVLTPEGVPMLANFLRGQGIGPSSAPAAR